MSSGLFLEEGEWFSGFFSGLGSRALSYSGLGGSVQDTALAVARDQGWATSRIGPESNFLAAAVCDAKRPITYNTATAVHEP